MKYPKWEKISENERKLAIGRFVLTIDRKRVYNRTFNYEYYAWVNSPGFSFQGKQFYDGFKPLQKMMYDELMTLKAKFDEI